jgi:trk system potassium uptake protein TrkH
MYSYLKFWRKLTPIQSLIIGFFSIVLVCTLMLMLPISAKKNASQPFIDALFVATSGISTTGLTPVDIGSYYTLFGQLVLLVLIQIGGLGYMVFILLIAYIIGYKPSFYTRVAFQESLAGTSMGNMRRMTGRIILFTVIFELCGAIILSIYWAHEFPVFEAIYIGIFHSISGFCTAGFGLFTNSLIPIQNNIFINVTIDIICFAGAMGFFILTDITSLFSRTRKRKRGPWLSLHSKLALTVAFALIVIGALFIYFTERKANPVGNGALTATFQAISASTTTGYNTVDIGSMNRSSLLMLCVLMFVGASPGSTGGGIKTTTLAVMVIALWALFTGRENVNVFRKRIPLFTVRKAFVLGLTAISLIVLDLLVMLLTEHGSFEQILFEIVSAFGNVGLSTGITPTLSVIGKIILTITMFIGRAGPLAIGLSMIGKPRPTTYQYSEERVYIG